MIAFWVEMCDDVAAVKCWSLSALIVSRPAHTLLMSRDQAPSAPYLPRRTSQLAKGFPGRANLSSFITPSQGCWSLPDAFFFFLSYLVTWGSYLQLWLYKRSSASFQSTFCENCSTFRCIFDVCVGGGEFHVLLLLISLLLCLSNNCNTESDEVKCRGWVVY